MAAEALLLRAKFFDDSYGTLAFSFGCVLFTELLFLWNYRDMFSVADRDAFLVFRWSLAGAVAVAGILASIFILHGELVVFTFKIFTVNLKWKARLLGYLTTVLLALVGFLCSSTGGSGSSPFSHYLTAIGSLSIVFATQLSTRLTMTTSSVVIFFLSGRYFSQVCEGVKSVACASSAAQVKAFLPFHTFCVAFAAAMALLAVLRNEPSPPRSPASTAQAR